MVLSPKLELRQGQQLVMTPQLQQAIRLLQLSNIELGLFVETELERNPLLERDERAAGAAGEGRAGEATGEEDGGGRLGDPGESTPAPLTGRRTQATAEAQWSGAERARR